MHWNPQILYRPFNQALVLDKGIFKFVQMDSNQTYRARKTKKLLQLATLFDQIVAQELSFFGQLKSFTDMLHASNIFTTTPAQDPIPEERTKSSIVKRSLIQSKSFNDSNTKIVNSSEVFKDNLPKSTVAHRMRRNIFDLFTPYSISQLEQTANTNYKSINCNFNQVHVTEMKFSHTQKQLHERYDTLNAQEITLYKKELFLELRTLKATFYSDSSLICKKS